MVPAVTIQHTWCIIVRSPKITDLRCFELEVSQQSSCLDSMYTMSSPLPKSQITLRLCTAVLVAYLFLATNRPLWLALSKLEELSNLQNAPDCLILLFKNFKNVKNSNFLRKFETLQLPPRILNLGEPGLALQTQNSDQIQIKECKFNQRDVQSSDEFYLIQRRSCWGLCRV